MTNLHPIFAQALRPWMPLASEPRDNPLLESDDSDQLEADDTDSDDEEGTCSDCSGTGEGRTEHDNCWTCKGSGVFK